MATRLPSSRLKCFLPKASPSFPPPLRLLGCNTHRCAGLTRMKFIEPSDGEESVTEDLDRLYEDIQIAFRDLE